MKFFREILPRFQTYGPVVVTAFVFFVLISQPVVAKSKAISKSIGDAKPFDISSSHLPVHYTGNNPAALYEKARRVLITKSEFETDEEYKTRANIAVESLGLYALVRLQDSRSSDEYERISYDAETEAFIITIPVIGGINDVVYLTRYRGEKGAYIGQNAFGAKVRVSKRDATRLIVRFSSDLDSLSKVVLKVPMPRDEAKRIKGNIRILYIGSPVKAERDTTHWTPELKDPYDTNVVIYSLEMKLSQIWVYNYQTGQILFKENQPSAAEVKWR